jgi:hypothetical protein
MLFLSSIVSSVHIFCETADADAAAALNAFLAKLRQADALLLPNALVFSALQQQQQQP